MDEDRFYGGTTRDGNGGTKSNLLEISALWVDIDWHVLKKNKGRLKNDD